MILSIGEILVDEIEYKKDDKTIIEKHLGGAPLNLAYAVKKAKGTSGFIGAIGNDYNGEYLNREAHKLDLDYLYLQKVKYSTTVARNTVTDNESHFAFIRDNSSDYHLNSKNIDLNVFKNLKIMNIGTLMLNTKEGKVFFNDMVQKAKEKGVKIAIDLNIRESLYKSREELVETYKDFVSQADIIHASKEEIEYFTGLPLKEGLKKINRENKVILVTESEEGSTLYYNKKEISAPSILVSVVDPTGAGDVFFGTFLKLFENIDITKTPNIVLKEILYRANVEAAHTVERVGALN